MCVSFISSSNFLQICSLTLHAKILSVRQSVKNHLWLIGFVVALLPLLLMRDFTPANELRYLSIADEALRNHAFFAFTNHGVPYADKPPLYLWLVMLLRSVFGGHYMLVLSALSMVPAVLIMSVMNDWGKQEMDAGTRLTTNMMLLTSGIFIGAAIMVRMDMLMALFIVLALRSFWRMYVDENAGKAERWRFPLYVFLALFTKGALGLLIPLFATVVFLVISHKSQCVWRYWGWRMWSVLIGCCALWWCMAYVEGGYSYVYDLLFHQTIGRTFHSFHHAHSFYYYFICIWYNLAPWSLLVLCSLVSAFRKKEVKSDLHKFFLTVSVTTMVLLSCISGKLQVYMLPAVPFMVYATGLYLPRIMQRWWFRPSLVVPACIFTLALPVLVLAECVGSVASFALPKMAHLAAYVSATILTISGVYAVCHVRKSVRSLSIGMMAAAFVAIPIIPVINHYSGYASVCASARRMSQEADGLPIVTWKMKNAEDMDVYLGQVPGLIPDDATPDKYLTTSAVVIERDKSKGGWKVVLIKKE